MRILYEGWDPEDRQPVRGSLVGLDRAQTQAADLVTVELESTAAAEPTPAAAAETEAASAPSVTPAAATKLSVTLKQNPVALKPGPSGVRVGACAWDGAYVLAAFLDAQPAGTFVGQRAVELGAGMGLPGLVLARLGAAVYLTDKPAATVFGRVNAGRNRLLSMQQVQPPPQQAQQQQQAPAPAPSSVAVLGLDWEDAPGAAAATAAITAGGPIDLVLGTDCIYPDPNGGFPSASGLLAAVCALATPGRTRALLTFETRSDALRAALLDAAAAAPVSCQVQQLPPEAVPQEYRAPHIELYELKF